MLFDNNPFTSSNVQLVILSTIFSVASQHEKALFIWKFFNDVYFPNDMLINFAQFFGWDP